MKISFLVLALPAGDLYSRAVRLSDELLLCLLGPYKTGHGEGVFREALWVWGIL